MPSTKKPGAIRPRRTVPSEGVGAATDRTTAAEPSRVGKRGTVVIPAALRRRYGIEEGSFVVAEPREGGILIRPALVLPIEVYTPERKAQFLLSNAIDADDYAGAVAEVRRMGLEPETIPHYKPPGV
jgi:AbrB family looped-hinge helix DNA binding protein